MKLKKNKVIMILSSVFIVAFLLLITISVTNATKIIEDEENINYDDVYTIHKQTETSDYLTKETEIPISEAHHTDNLIKNWVKEQENGFWQDMDSHNKRTEAKFILKPEIEEINDDLYFVTLNSHYEIEGGGEDDAWTSFTIDTAEDVSLLFKDILKEDFKTKKFKKLISNETDQKLDKESYQKLLSSRWRIENEKIVLMNEKQDKEIAELPLIDLYSFINKTYYDQVITGDLKDKVDDKQAEIKAEKERKKKEAEEKKRRKEEKAKENAKAKQNEEKFVAITFDDGPDPDVTPNILKTLDDYDVQATFFNLSKNTKAYPDLAKEVIDRGHEIGNHSINHYDMATLNYTPLHKEIIQSQKDIESVTGVKPKYFRTPYGSTTNTIRDLLSQSQQELILWSIDTEDWKNNDAASIVKVVQEETVPGAVILMHDIQPQTAQALPEILEYFEQEGYQQVTISEILPYIKDTYNGGYYGDSAG